MVEEVKYWKTIGIVEDYWPRSFVVHVNKNANEHQILQDLLGAGVSHIEINQSTIMLQVECSDGEVLNRVGRLQDVERIWTIKKASLA